MFILKFLCISSVSICLAATLLTFDQRQNEVESAIGCMQQIESLFFVNEMSASANVVTLYDNSEKLDKTTSDILMGYLRARWSKQSYFSSNTTSVQFQIIGAKNVKAHVNIHYYAKANFYVLVANTHDELKSCFNMISNSTKFTTETKFIILLYHPEMRYESAHMVFNSLEMLHTDFKVTDLVLLVAGAGTLNFEIYANHPLRYCDIIKHIKIGECSNGLLRNSYGLAEFLSNKRSVIPINVDSCNLTLCARSYAPFVVQGCDTGMEIEVVNILQNALQLNMSTECGNIERWEALKNQEKDIFHTLMEQDCDILVGGFFPSPEESRYYDRSTFYLENSYTWFVSLATTRPRWEGLMYIFQWNVWLGIGIVFLVSVITWVALERITRKEGSNVSLVNALSASWGLLLGNSLHSRPKRTPHRILFVFLALYSFAIDTFYTEQLIKTFTVPQMNQQIDSIEGILQANLPIGGMSDYITWFLSSLETDRRVYESYRIGENFLPSEKNLASVKHGKQAILASRLYVKSSKYQHGVHGISGNVFKNQLEMIVAKGFPFLKQVNLLLHYMMETGLIDKIIEDYQFSMSTLKNIRKTAQQNRKRMQADGNSRYGTVVLTVDHLQSAFVVFACGIAVSCAVFILEVFSKYLKP